MKTHQKSGPALICLTILIATSLVIAGCLEAAPGPQIPAQAANDKQSENPSAATTVTTRTSTVPAPLKTAQPAPAHGLSTAGIAIDPVSDKNAGDTFRLTATTSLTAGTEVLWQILPDTGTPPTTLDGNSMMSVGGNNLVVPGNGTSNRIVQAVDLGRLIPGKYVIIVGEMQGDFSDFKIGNRYGYTYFTLK
jgi:hypothetical protein